MRRPRFNIPTLVKFPSSCSIGDTAQQIFKCEMEHSKSDVDFINIRILKV